MPAASLWSPCAPKVCGRSSPTTPRSRYGCWSTAVTSSAGPAPTWSPGCTTCYSNWCPAARKKDLSAQQARALLGTVRPRDVVGKTRRRLASELIGELVVIDKKIKIAKQELTDLVNSTGSRLMDLTGIGPSGAARLIGDIGDIARFPSRAHFASWNGTAPIDASSGEQNRHRLSRAGNRRINRALHIMAIVQLRRDTEGRRYYRRRLAAGKTPMEALRALKRRLSDIVYRQMVADAKQLGTGPGGHAGATPKSSAADLNPEIDTSEKSLPGPAEPQPRTPLLIIT